MAQRHPIGGGGLLLVKTVRWGPGGEGRGELFGGDWGRRGGSQGAGGVVESPAAVGEVQRLRESHVWRREVIGVGKNCR